MLLWKRALPLGLLAWLTCFQSAISLQLKARKAES
jgi:hypothetical protein